jgi:hypothetical protein
MSYNFLPPPAPVRAPAKAAAREKPAPLDHSKPNVIEPRTVSVASPAKKRGPSSAATKLPQDGKS